MPLTDVFWQQLGRDLLQMPRFIRNFGDMFRSQVLAVASFLSRADRGWAGGSGGALNLRKFPFKSGLIPTKPRNGHPYETKLNWLVELHMGSARPKQRTPKTAPRIRALGAEP